MRAADIVDDLIDCRDTLRAEGGFHKHGRSMARMATAANWIEAAYYAMQAVSAIRPSNWDEDDDPDQVSAWRLLDEALGGEPVQMVARFQPSAAEPDPDSMTARELNPLDKQGSPQ